MKLTLTLLTALALAAPASAGELIKVADKIEETAIEYELIAKVSIPQASKRDVTHYYTRTFNAFPDGQMNRAQCELWKLRLLIIHGEFGDPVTGDCHPVPLPPGAM
ncbi:hypothetical protein [Maritimibacter sp. DP1N21-5]|uniref:hypothetical protein n=1 Tax=Maritimibacter sp. DP1N21-5 TaxID=2836867 RepID=UPI001C48BAC8|nr:hypothetical protein [Maritimibacter sp. DP1N21-5]MBV7408718.1 hypothetical protein [Maritimibacter sp. DP1N21-5]